FETRAGRRVGRNGQDCGSDPQGDSNFSSEGQETMNRPDCADAFETKSADAADDLAGAFEEFMTSFEAFKEANDARLAEIERRAAADPVTTEKVERISRALDEQKRVIDDIALKRVRPLLGRDDTPSIAALEHKQAFE